MDQYGEFSRPNGTSGDLRVNGTRTLGENMADVAGTKIAYRAYGN